MGFGSRGSRVARLPVPYKKEGYIGGLCCLNSIPTAAVVWGKLPINVMSTFIAANAYTEVLPHRLSALPTTKVDFFLKRVLLSKGTFCVKWHRILTRSKAKKLKRTMKTCSDSVQRTQEVKGWLSRVRRNGLRPSTLGSVARECKPREHKAWRQAGIHGRWTI